MGTLNLHLLAIVLAPERCIVANRPVIKGYGLHVTATYSLDINETQADDSTSSRVRIPSLDLQNVD